MIDHRQIFICNNYRFRGDWDEVPPPPEIMLNMLIMLNYVMLKIYLKNLTTVKKTLRKIWTLVKFLFAIIANVF